MAPRWKVFFPEEQGVCISHPAPCFSSYITIEYNWEKTFFLLFSSDSWNGGSTLGAALLIIVYYFHSCSRLGVVVLYQESQSESSLGCCHSNVCLLNECSSNKYGERRSGEESRYRLKCRPASLKEKTAGNKTARRSSPGIRTKIKYWYQKVFLSKSQNFTGFICRKIFLPQSIFENSWAIICQ